MYRCRAVLMPAYTQQLAVDQGKDRRDAWAEVKKEVRAALTNREGREQWQERPSAGARELLPG